MESDCCGAYSEYAEDIDICPECGEHADWNNLDETMGDGWNIRQYLRQLNNGSYQIMFTAKWGNEDYHSDKRENIVDWLNDKVANYDKYKEMMEIENKAITSFFEGTTTSKD